MSDSEQKRLSRAEAAEKIRSYCAYQERSQYQVRQRLYEYGLYSDEVNELIVELISENYLNELRFAQAYVRGKFSIKKWGRVKIKQSLYPHKLSDYILKKAFAEIDEEVYQETLKSLVFKKSKEVKLSNEFQRNGKIAQYVISRGYEPDLVWEIVKNL